MIRPTETAKCRRLVQYRMAKDVVFTITPMLLLYPCSVAKIIN